MLSPSIRAFFLLLCTLWSFVAMSTQTENTESNDTVSIQAYRNASECGGEVSASLNYSVDVPCSLIPLSSSDSPISSNVTCIEGGIPYGWICPTASCNAGATSQCELIDGQKEPSIGYGTPFCQVINNNLSMSITCEQIEAEPESSTSPEHDSPSSPSIPSTSPSSPLTPSSPSATPDFTNTEEPSTPSDASQLGFSMALLFLALGFALEALY